MRASSWSLAGGGRVPGVRFRVKGRVRGRGRGIVRGRGMVRGTLPQPLPLYPSPAPSMPRLIASSRENGECAPGQG